jgi:hypothetical protein
MIPTSAVTAVFALPVVIGTAAVCVLQGMHASVGLAAPTSTQTQEEDLDECALFRNVPSLKTNLAWRKLGTFPTPIHKGECSAIPIGDASSTKSEEGTTPTTAPGTVAFYVKREDLSSTAYGGNKVRTLQHQLAIIEAKLERGGQQRDLVVFGSGGSNQVVATVVHALRSKLAIPTMPLWMSDPPDLDNALNMLSTLSFPLGDFCAWDKPLTLVTTLLSKLIGGKSFLFPLGGNNPAGVLGQAGGALELAEQIEAGEIPDCDGIYLAVGSSCTISGLIIGVALARKLGLKAFSKPGFTLHPVLIHDILALLNRGVGLYKMSLSRYAPLTIRHSIHATCSQLTKLGGPDVLAEALSILENETVIHDDAFLTGSYGVHSIPSRTCARLFDSSATVTDLSGEAAPGLWLCGHFTAKAMAVMCDDLLKADNAGKDMIFWQTKSVVQPRGNKDEWKEMQQMPPAVKTWAQEGHAESEKRPGKVDFINGSEKDYRGVMTDIHQD